MATTWATARIAASGNRKKEASRQIYRGVANDDRIAAASAREHQPRKIFDRKHTTCGRMKSIRISLRRLRALLLNVKGSLAPFFQHYALHNARYEQRLRHLCDLICLPTR
jgi:hypothetical protein